MEVVVPVAAEGQHSEPEKMVECELTRIVIREHSNPQYIFLREKSGNRVFPIVIGVSEASEIRRKFTATPTERPLTHDLLRSAIHILGGRILRIEVVDLREGTFFANLILEQDGRVLRVDCRPSDAIALAVAEDAPVAVSELVLEEAWREHEQSG